jgi:hypothetical protein
MDGEELSFPIGRAVLAGSAAAHPAAEVVTGGRQAGNAAKTEMTAKVR